MDTCIESRSSSQSISSSAISETCAQPDSHDEVESINNPAESDALTSENDRLATEAKEMNATQRHIQSQDNQRPSPEHSADTDEDTAVPVKNRRRRIINDDDDDDENSVPYSNKSDVRAEESPEKTSNGHHFLDSDDEENVTSTTSKKVSIVDDDDEDDEDDNLEAGTSEQGPSQSLVKKLVNLCDDESSEDEQKDDDEEEVDQEKEGQPEVNEERPGKTKSKNKCAEKEFREDGISILQKNARENILDVPYHCPEQYPLKEFLQRLKASKGTLISEEKVEIKTSKLKLLKDVPRLEIPVPDPGTSESFEAETADAQPGPSNATNVPEKLTLKGDPNSMIDLGTCSIFDRKGVADFLIENLMKTNRNGLRNKDPKFMPEPVPGAPLKQLKRSLESELQKRRKETILKILHVEQAEKGSKKVAEDEDEDEEEFEDESDAGSDEDKHVAPNKLVTKSQVAEDIAKEFNDDEEELARGEEDNVSIAEEQENDDDDDDNGEEDEIDEEDGEEDDLDSDLESDTEEDKLEWDGIRKPLKRIITLDDDSDDEATATEALSAIADIPTETTTPQISATQNELELFDLCSGTFSTQVPTVTQTDDNVAQLPEFKEPSLPVVVATEAPAAIEVPTIAESNKPDLSSSEDEAERELEPESKKCLKKRKLKRRLIDDDDDEDGDDEMEEQREIDDAEDDDEVDTLADDPIVTEELEEYRQFLTGDQQRDEKSKRLRVTDFIEKEAELSESEWGSEDEDERGLDHFDEMDLARDDEFDKEQLRDELGRIHMRQMQNEDNRELKYLKDLILNEEEKDGEARQRTFRWLNVNSAGDDFGGQEQNAAPEEGDEDAANKENDDEEDEENWRRIRYERDQMIKANKEEGTEMARPESKLETVIKEADRTVRLAKTEEKQIKEYSSPSFLMQEQSKQFMNLKQSFLLRDDHTLSRLATISAKASDLSNSVSEGKQNFVFRRIEGPASATTPITPTGPKMFGAESKKRKSNGSQQSSPIFTANPQNLKKRKV